jgi:hypothetical protein
LIAPARGVNGIIADELVKAIKLATESSSLTTVDNRNTLRTSAPSGSSGASMRILNKSKLKVAHIRDLYRHFEYSDLVKHPAIVILPYQVRLRINFEWACAQYWNCVLKEYVIADFVHVVFRVLSYGDSNVCSVAKVISPMAHEVQVR